VSSLITLLVRRKGQNPVVSFHSAMGCHTVAGVAVSLIMRDKTSDFTDDKSSESSDEPVQDNAPNTPGFSTEDEEEKHIQAACAQEDEECQQRHEKK
jgi:hypothetical protein